MDHGPTLVPDVTIVFQLVIFMASYLVMRTFVFKPFANLLEIRESKTTGLAKRASESESNAKALKEKYESEMAAERQHLSKWVEQEKQNLSSKVTHRVTEARDKAATEIETIRLKADEEARVALDTLSPKVGEFASEMSSQILGYSVNIKSSTASPSDGERPRERAPS